MGLDPVGWLAIVTLGVVSVGRAIRWLDQPFASAFITPSGLAAAVAGLLLSAPIVILIGMAMMVIGFLVDRFYMWRADSTGHMHRRDPP